MARVRALEQEWGLMNIRNIFAAAGLLAVAGAANASSVYLDFEGIAPHPNSSDVVIGGFYNGGTASNGASGPNLGVEFTSDAILLCLNTTTVFCSNTSRGGQGISTSQLGALFFPSGNPTMNVAAGFDTGFSFVYSDPFAAGTTIEIFDGLNATGTMLASVVLPGTTNGASGACAAYGSPNYCPFDPYSISFAGVAKSVRFAGTVNRQVFDDFTFGSTVVGGGVPEPATWAMMILGFGLVGSAARRRVTRVAA
jgi:hypothetical protein